MIFIDDAIIHNIHLHINATWNALYLINKILTNYSIKKQVS